MKKFLIFIGVPLFILGLIAVFIYINSTRTYSEIINTNWSIKLPNSYKEIYSKDSGGSFHGDGERYHILQYSKEDDVSLALNWQNGKNDVIESNIKQILNTLSISNKNMPDFQNKYKYYTQKKKDSSVIYLILATDTKMLYIIEEIL